MKTETFTVLDYQEFNELVAEHLGVPTYNSTDGSTYGNYDFGRDMEMGQDSYIIFEPEEFEEGDLLDDEYPVTYKYVRQLFDKGVFTKDLPVFVKVSW